MSFGDIENLMPLKESTDKTKILCTLLKGQSLSYFGHHLEKWWYAEDSELPENDLIKLVIRDIGLEYTRKCARRVQKYYLR